MPPYLALKRYPTGSAVPMYLYPSGKGREREIGGVLVHATSNARTLKDAARLHSSAQRVQCCRKERAASHEGWRRELTNDLLAEYSQSPKADRKERASHLPIFQVPT